MKRSFSFREKHEIAQKEYRKVQESYPETVFPFLLCPDTLNTIKELDIKFFFNIHHDLYNSLWSENFKYLRYPLKNCIDNMTLGDRIWSFDYPHAKANNADKGCGVSVFAIASAQKVFEIISNYPTLNTVREVVMPCRSNFHGFVRYYIDWDEQLSEESRSEISFSILASERIKLMTAHFKTMLNISENEGHIVPLPSVSTRRDNKLSIHIMFGGACFDNTDDFKSFDKMYCDSFPRSDLKHCIDPSTHEECYTSNCLSFLRAIKSRKAHYKSHGVFVPLGVINEASITAANFEEHLAWSHEQRDDIVFTVTEIE